MLCVGAQYRRGGGPSSCRSHRRRWGRQLRHRRAQRFDVAITSGWWHESSTGSSEVGAGGDSGRVVRTELPLRRFVTRSRRTRACRRVKGCAKLANVFNGASAGQGKTGSSVYIPPSLSLSLSLSFFSSLLFTGDGGGEWLRRGLLERGRRPRGHISLWPP